MKILNKCIIAAFCLIFARAACCAFAESDMSAMSARIKELSPDFKTLETLGPDKPSSQQWYDKTLFPWLEQFAEKSFLLKDTKPLHSFNVKLVIVLENGQEARCSSVRIHKNWLLSAAHCAGDVKSVKVLLEDKNGAEILRQPAGMFFIEGRQQRIAEAEALAAKFYLASATREDVYHFIMTRLDAIDDFMLVKIDTAGIEESADNTWLPRIVRLNGGEPEDKDLFIISKYWKEGLTKASILHHRFKKLGKTQVFHEDKTALVTTPASSFSSAWQGDSGSGLLGKEGVYGIMSFHSGEEEFFVPFNDKTLQLMETAMGADYKDIVIVEK